MFSLVKYKYLPSFWDLVEVDRTIFRFLGNKWKNFFFPDGRARLGGNLWFDFFFVIIFTLFSVCPFLKFEVPKCREFYVDFKKNIHTFFLGVMCIYFHLYTRKCPNYELLSHKNVRNRYRKIFSAKTIFSRVKYKYLPSFWDLVEVDRTIFRILGNKWKKLFFPGRASSFGRKSLIWRFFFCDNIYSVFCLSFSKVWGTKM